MSETSIKKPHKVSAEAMEWGKQEMEKILALGPEKYKAMIARARPFSELREEVLAKLKAKKDTAHE